MTTTAEIMAWFGIRFAMACMKISNSKKYWSIMAGWKNNLICATMARNRFDEISGCLQLADPDNHATDLDSWPTDTTDERRQLYEATNKNPLYRLNHIWNTVLQQCKTLYHLRREIAVDEAMVRYKGPIHAYQAHKSWLKDVVILRERDGVHGKLLISKHQKGNNATCSHAAISTYGS